MSIYQGTKIKLKDLCLKMNCHHKYLVTYDIQVGAKLTQFLHARNKQRKTLIMLLRF